jgi:germination protein M
MNWRVLLIALTAVGLFAILLWLVTGTGGPAARFDREIPVDQLPTPTPPPEQQVVLLFLGPDGRLHPELRTVPLPEEVGARARVVVEELLAGSIGGLGSVIPYQADVNAVFVDERGNAFIDLTAPPEPLEGSHLELTLAYGVVDSVLLNCPELRAVQILFGGREVATLTGHLDLSRPLVLNKRFIAQS